MASSYAPTPYHEALYQLANTAAESSASPRSPRVSYAVSPDLGVATSSSNAAAAAADKKISCMECRLSKVKCSGGDFCSRCQRLGKACYYKSHKRGRKSDSSKIQKLEKTVETLSQALENFSQYKATEHPTGVDASSSPASSEWNSRSRPRRDTLPTASSSTQQQQSSAWHAAHPTAPTPDDPDEPDNLGLPTLSNPLKLLAHASDSARDRDWGPTQMSSIDPALQTSTSGPSAANLPPSSTPDRPNATAATSVSRFGPARGKVYFSVGLFAPRPDNLPQFDPIQCQIVSLVEAESLFSVYMQYINPPLTLLDQHLHTFGYVRSSSSFLLCAACWIAAKYRTQSARAAANLESHIRTTLLPAVLLDAYRSAEIAQAFIILAAYHPQTNTLSEDRSWSYVGYAIRIASELDMNSKIASKSIDNSQANSELVRRLRNRERTWLNLWLYETSLSQHMGRRPTLASDPVVMGCARWHLDRFAIPEDAAMVAVVQLRLLMTRNIELFENFVDVSATYHPNETTGMQIELFRRTCATDLDTWLATWATHSETTHETDATASSRRSDLHSQPPQRLQKAKLYYWYARLLLDTMALKCSHLGLKVLRPIYKDAYACAMAYLGLFVATMVPNGLLWGHNSTVVTPAYCAIFALRVTGLVSSDGAVTSPTSQSVTEQDAGLNIDIDAEYTFDMVEKVIKVFEEAGNVTAHRQGAAGSYAPFLATVLLKAKTVWSDKQSNAQSDSVVALHKKQKQSNILKSASQTANSSASDANNSHTTRYTPASSTSIYTPDEADVPARMADDTFLCQMMQFQAGPSGVQAIPGQNTSTPAHAAGQDGMQWDFGILDGFLGESLFSDMSFISGEPHFAQTPLQSGDASHKE